MNFTKKIISTSIFIAVTSLTGNVIAQNREIQDSLIYTDPTVSKSSDYIYGGSLEYWYSHKSLNTTDYNASATLTQPGINFFVGKDNLTASISYKGNGSSNVSISTAPTTTYGAGVFTEVEGSLRMLSKDRYFQTIYPYAIVGYLSGRSDTYKGSVSYTAPILGLGGIIPFNDKFGLRTDVKLLTLKQSPDSHFSSGYSNNTSGNLVTGNFYWNLDDNWNAQFGARKTYYAGGGALSYGLNNTSIGYFAMIGKTFK